jgi:vacuolar-type H+-ATPase subunit C/Vma6
VEQLAPLLDDEDRRSIRVLVRGAVAGAPPDVRVASLIPTPSLPLRALHQLATAGDMATVGAQLLAWRHPFAAAVADEAQRQHVDLFRFEVALTRAFAARERGTCGRDAAMRLFVERSIDFENLWTVLILADQHADIDPASMFVPGGSLIRVDDIVAAAHATNRLDVAERLLGRVAHTPLAAALAAGGRAVDDASLAALVQEFRDLSRTEPLGLAPVVHFVLRQRAELHALMRITWSISLHVPAALIERALGAAA